MYEELIEKALKLVEEKKYDEAIKVYEEAFEVGYKIENYFDYGIILMEQRYYEKSIDVIKKVVSERPFAQGYFVLGVLSTELQKYADSIDYYLMAIELDKDFYEARFNLADIYANFEEDDLAIEQYQLLLEQQPDNFWTNLNIGVLYEKHDILDKALNHLLLCYDMKPNERLVSYNLGVVYGKMKKYDLAEKCYLEEVKKNNGYVYGYLNLGILYKDIYHDMDKALEVYKQGIKVDAMAGEIWYNIGCIYALKKDYEEAFKYIQESFYKDPTIIEYALNDDELIEFRKLGYYDKLFKGNK